MTIPESRQDAWLEEMLSEPAIENGGFSRQVMRRIRRRALLLDFLYGVAVLACCLLAILLVKPVLTQLSLPVAHLEIAQVIAVLISLGICAVVWLDTEASWRLE